MLESNRKARCPRRSTKIRSNNQSIYVYTIDDSVCRKQIHLVKIFHFFDQSFVLFTRNAIQEFQREIRFIGRIAFDLDHNIVNQFLKFLRIDIKFVIILQAYDIDFDLFLELCFFVDVQF